VERLDANKPAAARDQLQHPIQLMALSYQD